MNVDVVGALSDLAARRPVFHSEPDFQHGLAWQIQLNYPPAEIRLETRPRRSVHLDMLIRLGGTRTAVELKYLVAALHITMGEYRSICRTSRQTISAATMSSRTSRGSKPR